MGVGVEMTFRDLGFFLAGMAIGVVAFIAGMLVTVVG